jgi:hypothetical protein
MVSEELIGSGRFFAGAAQRGKEIPDKRAPEAKFLKKLRRCMVVILLCFLVMEHCME